MMRFEVTGDWLKGKICELNMRPPLLIMFPEKNVMMLSEAGYFKMKWAIVQAVYGMGNLHKAILMGLVRIDDCKDGFVLMSLISSLN